jgi:hypothetical protein
VQRPIPDLLRCWSTSLPSPSGQPARYRWCVNLFTVGMEPLSHCGCCVHEVVGTLQKSQGMWPVDPYERLCYTGHTTLVGFRKGGYRNPKGCCDLYLAPNPSQKGRTNRYNVIIQRFKARSLLYLLSISDIDFSWECILFSPHTFLGSAVPRG